MEADLSRLQERIKSLILAHAPSAALGWLKKRHYVRAVRTFSEPDVEVVRRLIDPGDQVVDIGANVGWYTNLMSGLVGADGSVTSFEPVPPTFEILTHCVEALGLQNVCVLNCAVSQEEGTVSMEVPDYGEGGKNFYQAHIVSPISNAENGRPDFSAYQVESKTLDSQFSGAEVIRFIKCDVEGHELAVIEGGVRLIEAHHPIWLLEINDDPDEPDSQARRLLDRLAGFGYSPYWYDGDALRERMQGDRSVNYFFLTQQHCDALRGRSIQMIRAQAS